MIQSGNQTSHLTIEQWNVQVCHVMKNMNVTVKFKMKHYLIGNAVELIDKQ